MRNGNGISNLVDELQIHNYWTRFGIEYEVWDIFLCHFFSCALQLKIMNLPTGGNFGPTKYPRENILGSRNTHEKIFSTHEIPTRKKFWPTKYLRKHDGTMALDPRDPQSHATHEIYHNPPPRYSSQNFNPHRSCQFFHPRQNFDPCHLRHFFDPCQSFTDPRHPRYPRKSLTHTTHEPAH